MFGFLRENALWQLVAMSDFMTAVVLLTLLFLSIVCWSIFFYKFILFRNKQRQLDDALNKIKGVSNFEALLQVVSGLGNSLPGYFLAKNLSFLKSMLEEKKEERASLSVKEVEILQYNSDQIIADIIHNEESNIPFLTVSTTISPLLGLFGTVWGLVQAFIKISEKQSADIAAVAPGIAQALITTVAGLLVAIPAMAMGYYLNLKVRDMEFKLISLADKFNLLAQKL